MCGIVGYVGRRQASDILIPALRRLEYRGYDSAGIASLNGGGLDVLRAVGKLSDLERRLVEHPVAGTAGIGHTRWATHGRVSEENAHPHRAGRVAVIHNGIIENFLELRSELSCRGRTLRSQTDTEVIAHLIDENVAAGADLLEATRTAVERLHGSFAIVVLSETDPDRLVAAKTATPIVVGVGRGECFVASDVPALLDHTREVLFLEDGELVELTPDGICLTGFDRRPRVRFCRHIDWDPVHAAKGGHRHFLAKEIHEQPEAVASTLRGRTDGRGESVLAELEPLGRRLAAAERVVLVGCGTSWHAALVGKFFLNALARIPVEVDYGSELRYRGSSLSERDLVVAISQSGETADTLGSVEEAARIGATTLAISNVVESSIARRAEGVVYTHAGPEISVCSTKAFTTQLAALLLLSVHLGRLRGRLDEGTVSFLRAELGTLPGLVRRSLETEEAVAAIAREISGVRDALFLGRGVSYPIALEGALKLKEISYVHAEGVPGGEMRHGPMALVTDGVPVIFVVPRDATLGATLSDVKEVESRGGRVVIVTDGLAHALRGLAWRLVEVPSVPVLLSPFTTTIPLQLLAYHVAVARGTDVDQPRNLAKSVTVE